MMGRIRRPLADAVFSAWILVAATTAAASASVVNHEELLSLHVPEVRISAIDCFTRVQVPGYATLADPCCPALPYTTITLAVHPGIDWSTFSVDVLSWEEESRDVPLPVEPARLPLHPSGDGGVRDASFWRSDRPMAGPVDPQVCGTSSEYPGPVLRFLGPSRQRAVHLARLCYAPVQYRPVEQRLRIVSPVEVRVRYAYDPTVRPEVDHASPACPGPAVDNPVPLACFYPPAAPSPHREPTYNYVIITSNHIATNSTKLPVYIAHKTAQGYTVLLQTVESIEGQYTRFTHGHLFESTDERADRIKAFLKDKYLAYGIRYVMLVGNPDPDNPLDGSDAVGNVPMKFCFPDNHYGTKFAPTDQFYCDLSGRWDLSDNGLFGEEADRGPGGIDLAGLDLYVGRLPYYTTSLANLDSIFQKIMDYETVGAPEAWKRKCFLPNPIDYSDNYGQEGNLSPITMAEWIKNSVLVPAEFAYYRLYEHKYNWYPLNVSPDPERIPDGVGYTCVTYYDSARRFKAALNTTSEEVAAYPIGEMTDNNNSTYYENTSFQPNHYLQFKQTHADLLQANYVPARVIIRSTSAALLPQQFTIQMAANAAFSDAYTIVTESDAAAHAVLNSGYWQLQYDYPTTLTAVSYRRYIRLKYTGTAPQAVRINEFRMFTEEHKSIEPYVIPEWQQTYGVVYYNTHGSATTASDIITSSQCSQLNNSRPSFVFSKACSTGQPETTNNLCASYLFNGGIAAIGASRVSYGWGDMGYQLIMPRLIQQNQRFGVVYGDTCATAAAADYYGWGGYFEDALRFNLYGDPTVALLTDADGDGLPYWLEEQIGTNPQNADTDGDGVADGEDNCPSTHNPDQQDSNEDGVGDACQSDCNNNGILDHLEIQQGSAQDCNGNVVPDDCDLTNGTSQDTDGNGIPDECPGGINLPPVVDAGAEQAITMPAIAFLDATVTDDGWPRPPQAVTVTWSRDDGPGTVTFGNLQSIDTTASFTLPGTYVLRLTAFDGALTSSDTVTITVHPPANQPPLVNAGADLYVPYPDPGAATLSPTVSDDGLPYPPGQLSFLWEAVSGPTPVIFANPQEAVTTVQFHAPGVYTLRLTASDGEYQTADELAVFVLQQGYRIVDGLVAYYTFDESGGDVVHDRSAVGTPLDLTIAHPAYTTWTGGGLAVNAATLITSGGPATKIFQALTASNALTLELWITPLSVSQTGPPRILTLSPDTNNRNASLVQGLSGTLPKDVIDAKLRTTATTNNASPSIVTAAGSLTPALTHVVYTRDAAGVARIYLDNVLRASGTIGGNLSNWDPAYPLALANEPSLNRPWLGTFHLAAIYQRALAPAEIAHHFAIGPEPVTTVAGDLNCDGRLDLDDIPAFVLALLDEDGFAAQYPACDRLRADLNHDGIVDGADVQGLVQTWLAD